MGMSRCSRCRPKRSAQRWRRCSQTLSPEALNVPSRLVPLLSSARNGSDNRQFEIEVFGTEHGPLFDPLIASDVASEITLTSLLAPARLARVSAQHAIDGSMLGVEEILDKLWSAVAMEHASTLSRRITYRTVTVLAATAQDKATSPEVAALIDQKLFDVGEQLAKRDGDADDKAWAASLSRKLLDPRQRAKLAADLPRSVPVPPGDPIGGGESDWMDLF